jgi:hypothetical protein
MRRSASLLALAGLLLATAGCLYSFTGGGLPRHIRTVAVLPFENGTAQPLLEAEIERSMQLELPRNLGVRLAAEQVADAVVRGRITGFDEAATSVRPTGPQDQQTPVVQREVRITYEAEIYDMREDRPLWRAQSQSVVGNYQPERESIVDARARAIRELVRRVIEGAQSQW